MDSLLGKYNMLIRVESGIRHVSEMLRMIGVSLDGALYTIFPSPMSNRKLAN